jgi:hypothetical protein
LVTKSHFFHYSKHFEDKQTSTQTHTHHTHTFNANTTDNNTTTTTQRNALRVSRYLIRLQWSDLHAVLRCRVWCCLRACQQPSHDLASSVVVVIVIVVVIVRHNPKQHTQQQTLAFINFCTFSWRSFSRRAFRSSGVSASSYQTTNISKIENQTEMLFVVVIVIVISIVVSLAHLLPVRLIDW